MSSKKHNNKLLIIMLINFLIFFIANTLFDVKYEQVDDFIIYNLYSGLDGTYNLHGVYIHPFICLVISILYRIISFINWHSIFLLSMQFICFTLIGYTILKKNNNSMALLIYAIFASIFYTTLLMLIQYTSVSALLISTAFFLLVDLLEKEENKSKIYKIIIFCLFTIGIMMRMQSLLIILPFMGVYYLIYLIEFVKKDKTKENIFRITKYYIGYVLITIVVFISYNLYYNMNPLYKEYMEFNDMRTYLHDIAYVDYEENKEIFDEIGWSANDYYLFYTFDFGDEDKYSKENLKKIYDYKIQKDGKYNFDKKISEIEADFESDICDVNTYIFILFITIFIINLWNKSDMKRSILIFIATISMHLLFIIINRNMLRVIIPEYILGTALMIYNLEIPNKQYLKFDIEKLAIIFITLVIFVTVSGTKYQYGYELDDYLNYQDLIEYTNENRQNVYLYTVPSLQFRYYAYSVYEMPPKGAFSNLRVLGGWDMYTQNYYDFKNRYNLEGKMIDLLKDNVYLIDGNVYWSGIKYENYKENIAVFIKENYDKDVEFIEIKNFDNLTVYKVVEKQLNEAK